MSNQREMREQTIKRCEDSIIQSVQGLALVAKTYATVLESVEIQLQEMSNEVVRLRNEARPVIPAAIFDDIDRLTRERNAAQREIDSLTREVHLMKSQPSLEWGPDEGDMTWNEAFKLAAAKGDGWRLPTVQELVGQYDYDKGAPKDESWPARWFWSSSPDGDDSAWFVYFGIGSVSSNIRSDRYGARCVRSTGSGSLSAK